MGARIAFATGVAALSAALLSRHSTIPAAGAGGWTTIDSATAVWAADHPAYDFLIDEYSDSDHVDSSGYRLRIRGPSNREVQFRNPAGEYAGIAEALRDTVLAASNLLTSNYLLLSPAVRTLDGSPMLLAFGRAYGSSPGYFLLLGLTRSGSPTKLLELETFEVIAVSDLDGNGSPEIVGKPSFSQCSDCSHCSYDPFAVYQVPRDPSQKATYTAQLSREYNTRYYVWAGPRASERVSVNSCRPDKPHLTREPH